MPRPKEPILSRDLIRDQALAIIDEDGLDALTMRRLADRFNVQAASLYTHFPNKEAVLNAIAERLAKRIDPTGFADSWQAGLRTWANSYYEAIHWHPNAAPVVAAGAGGQGVDAAVAEQIQTGLLDHGWPSPDAEKAASAVKFLVLGAAASTTAHHGPDGADSIASSGRPRGSSVRSGIQDPADPLDRASFAYALDSLMRGLESVYETFGTSKRKSRTSPAKSAQPRAVEPRRRQRPA